MGLAGTITGPERASIGENSRLMIGGTSHNLDGQMIRFVTGMGDVSAGEIDVTDNMSGGFTEATRQPRTFRLAADCIWRALDNPIGNLPLLKEGEHCGRVLFWPDFDNQPAVVFKLPIGLCLGFSITAAGAGDIRFSVSIRNQKTYYTPSRPDPNGPIS